MELGGGWNAVVGAPARGAEEATVLRASSGGEHRAIC